MNKEEKALKTLELVCLVLVFINLLLAFMTKTKFLYVVKAIIIGAAGILYAIDLALAVSYKKRYIYPLVMVLICAADMTLDITSCI